MEIKHPLEKYLEKKGIKIIPNTETQSLV